MNTQKIPRETLVEDALAMIFIYVDFVLLVDIGIRVTIRQLRHRYMTQCANQTDRFITNFCDKSNCLICNVFIQTFKNVFKLSKCLNFFNIKNFFYLHAYCDLLYCT